MKRRTLILAAAAAFGLPSCMTNPPGLPETLPRERASLPAAWNAPDITGSAASARDNWWVDLGIPELTTLIEKGFSRSHSMRSALAALEAARAEARAVGADLYPYVDLGAGYSWGRTVSSTSGKSQTSRTAKIAAAASWELDFWGRNRNEREAAIAAADSKLWASRAVRLSLSGSIARQYLALLNAREMIRISESNLEIMRKTSEITDAKLSAGTATPTDAETARSDVATAEAALANRKLAADLALHALALLTADPELALPEANGPLPSAPSVRPGIPSELLQNRPDVRAAASTLQSAHASVAVAYAAFFPSISLTGSAGTQSRTLGALFSKGIWSAGISLDLPIFDAGRRSAEYDRSKAVEAGALEAYRLAAETAYADVRDALSSIQYSREAERSRLAALNSARSAVKNAQSRYQHGSGSFLALLTAQRALNDASVAHESAKLATLESFISLNLALGAGRGTPES